MTEKLSPASPSHSMAASDSILHHLSHAYHEIAAAFERHIGMSRARWAVLSRLSRDGCLTQATLARVLHVDAAAITRQVKQLEAEGLITRWPAPDDNRYTVVGLTDAGQTFVASQRAVRDDFERMTTTGLNPDDIDHMRRCLLHMRRNLADLEGEG